MSEITSGVSVLTDIETGKKGALPAPHGPIGDGAAEVARGARGAFADAPMVFRLAARIATRIRVGSILAELPDGRWFRFAGPEAGPEGVLKIKDYAFAKHLLTGGSIGFAEAHFQGLWDSPDVATFLQVIALNAERMDDYFKANPWRRFLQRTMHFLNANSRRGSKRNISFHYDLGNGFYELWLDPSMTYSSARFAAPEESLIEAQQNKYRSLAKRIELGSGNRVLEIGCGWGGFAEYAAKTYDCHLTGITISREQYDFSRKRMFEQGLNEKVDIQFRDYRDVEETYDRVASIEMFEAVGEKYWPTYFSKIREVLAPGGKAGLQIITIDDRHFDKYRRTADFIQKYIFPGGMLPSPSVLKRQIADAGLTFVDHVDFGLDYARTLREWRDRFLAAWPQIEPMGFDERFRRIWSYYLSYCEAGFKAGNIDVTQVSIARS